MPEQGIAGKPTPTNDGCYIGEIRAFATNIPPDNWLECDGSEYKISQYSKLAGVIGNLWGSTTIDKFRLPDLRGTFLRGWNHGKTGPFSDPEINLRTLPVGAPGLAKDVVGSYQADSVGEHQHSITLPRKWGDRWASPPGWSFDDGRNPDGNPDSSAGTNPLGSRETRPINAYVMYCIRAK